MTLFDAKVSYFAIPETILRLHSKTSVLTALKIYRSKNTDVFREIEARPTSYRARQLTEIKRELIGREVLEETEDGLKLRCLDTQIDSRASALRVNLPCKFEYESLTLTALKTVIALHSLSRYGRRGGLLKQQCFEIIATQKSLATKAQVAERGLRDARKELETVHMVRTERVRKAGSNTARVTKFILLDPGSGIELSFLGDYFLEQARKVPVHDRYKYLLSHLDPKGKLQDIRLGISSYRVHCPFCRSRKEPTFRFNSTEEGDHWGCFNCRRSGTSDFLWAKFSQWPIDWRKIMADAGVTAPDVDDPLFGDSSDFYPEHTTQTATPMDLMDLEEINL